MIVTLLEKERIFSLWLPQKKKGTYRIQDGKSRNPLLSVKAIQGEWIAKSASGMWFVDEKNHPVDEICIRPFHLYSVRTMETDYIGHIIVEPDISFERYTVHSANDIVIGRKRENDISIDSIAVSSVHARLSKKGMQWILSDENSVNGVYVNNIRIKNSCILQPGDVIYIMGLRIIAGKGFLAVSNPNHMIALNPESFVPFRNKPLHKTIHRNRKIPKYYIPDSHFPVIENDAIEQCVDIIENGKTSLWSCDRKQSGFLRLNIGSYTDVNLRQYPMIEVWGNTEDRIAFCKGLLLQFITYYSYADVKIIFLLDEEAAYEFKTARWLPHIWDNEKQQSFYVSNTDEVEKLSLYFKNKYKKSAKNEKPDIPHYIILGFDGGLEERLDVQGLRDIVSMSQISFVAHYGKDFSECNIRLELDDAKGSIFYLAENRKQEFVPTISIKEDIDLLYLQLANTQMDLGTKNNIYNDNLMVELYVPAYGNSYDIIIPQNRRIGEILPFIEKQIVEKERTYELSKGNAILCDREDGIVLDVELTPEESGVLNGTRLMLI